MRISDWSSDVCSSDLVDGEAAAMIVCLPNLNEAIADLDGKLLPFGWAKLLWRLKVSGVKSCRVPLFGVRKRYHRSALGAALILVQLEALRVSAAKAGFRHAELSWILEDRSEEHTSELQSLMRISYAVFCLKKKK